MFCVWWKNALNFHSKKEKYIHGVVKIEMNSPGYFFLMMAMLKILTDFSRVLFSA